MSEDISQSTQETEALESTEDEVVEEDVPELEIEEPAVKEKSSVDDDIDSFFG